MIFRMRVESISASPRCTHGRVLLILLLGWHCVCFYCWPARAQETGKKPVSSCGEVDGRVITPITDPFDAVAATEDPSEAQSPWFILPSMINVYPKLESEGLVDKYFNPAMRLLAPGFDDVRTISTLRDEHILWTPIFAIGRNLSEHWALYLQCGYSGGKVRTKADDRSIFLVPLHTDFEIYRSAAYVGVCADLFPWGMPKRRKYYGLWDRLRNSKPTLGLRLTQNYASFEAKVKAGFGKSTHLLDLELNDNWWVTSFNANVGAEIPVDERNALSLNAGYNFAFTRGFDFDATALTVGWKYYFK